MIIFDYNFRTLTQPSGRHREAEMVTSEAEQNQEFNKLYKAYNFHAQRIDGNLSHSITCEIVVTHVVIVGLGHILSLVDLGNSDFDEDDDAHHLNELYIFRYRFLFVFVAYILLPVPWIYVLFRRYKGRVESWSNESAKSMEKARYFEKVMLAAHLSNSVGLILTMFCLATVHGVFHSWCDENTPELSYHSCVDHWSTGLSAFSPSIDSAPQMIIHIHMILFALMHEVPFVTLHYFINISNFTFLGMMLTWVFVDVYFGVSFASNLIIAFLSFFGLR